MPSWRSDEMHGAHLLALDVQHLVHVSIDARARRAAGRRISAHQVELAVDDITSHSMAGKFHGGQDRPPVRDWIVGLHGTERSLILARPLLSSRHVDLALEQSPRAGA